MKDNTITKSSKAIHREVIPGRTQFWASMVGNNGKYAVVTTNLPTQECWLDAEGKQTEFSPEKAGELKKVLVAKQTDGAERVGVGLQAVRVYAQEKGYDMAVAKVVMTQEANSDVKVTIVLHKVTPLKKGSKWVFDLERQSAFSGGFPEGTIASEIAAEQLAAFGIDINEFVGTQIQLKEAGKKKQPKKAAANRLKENLNNLGLAFNSIK